MALTPIFTSPDFPADYNDTLIEGDCLDVLQSLPDKAVDVIITDPPWPGCSQLKFPGSKTAWSLWREAVKECARISRRLVVILGCDSDPRFLQVPPHMPFVRVVCLERIPARYRGPILYNMDVAYVFGERFLNCTEGLRVLPGLYRAVLQKDRQPENPHPTRRHLDHCRFLVYHFSRPGQLILDPFCGSGQILVAAKALGRRFCGVDVELGYLTYAARHLDSIPPDLFGRTTGADNQVCAAATFWGP